MSCLTALTRRYLASQCINQSLCMAAAAMSAHKQDHRISAIELAELVQGFTEAAAS